MGWQGESTRERASSCTAAELGCGDGVVDGVHRGVGIGWNGVGMARPGSVTVRNGVPTIGRSR